MPCEALWSNYTSAEISAVPIILKDKPRVDSGHPPKVFLQCACYDFLVLFFAKNGVMYRKCWDVISLNQVAHVSYSPTLRQIFGLFKLQPAPADRVGLR